MEWNEQTYHKIQAYIDNDLTLEAQAAFETEMDNNPALAREVTLSQDLQELLADTPENALRKSLYHLSEQVKEENRDKAATTHWWIWGILLLFVIGTSWLFYTKNAEAPPVKAIDNIQMLPSDKTENNKEANIKNEAETVPTSPKEEEKKEIIILPPSTPQKEKQKEPKEEISIPPIASVDESEKPKDAIVQEPEINKEPSGLSIKEMSSIPSSPIASNFQPNPELDFLISNNLRDSEIVFEIEKLTTEVDVSSEFKAMTFQFGGRLTAEKDLLNKNFKIHIFSNDKTQFRQFLPLFSNNLELERLNAQTYSFHFIKHYLLSSGLYYFLLEDADKERVYFVEKFSVNLKK